ncbi:Hypothetical predicted protein [Cloeon dipterum]|uniref:Uncharacterized protein n=1 Tax=Cloeon dipterum TaxID=197152 RepID=A0A8S1E6X1_9INSE|nr:Hypothetical predicted protein [Cloeon dipterum]
MQIGVGLGPKPGPPDHLDGLYSFSSQPKAFLAHRRKNQYLNRPSLIPVSRRHLGSAQCQPILSHMWAPLKYNS